MAAIVQKCSDALACALGHLQTVRITEIRNAIEILGVHHIEVIAALIFFVLLQFTKFTAVLLLAFLIAFFIFYMWDHLLPEEMTNRPQRTYRDQRTSAQLPPFSSSDYNENSPHPTLTPTKYHDVRTSTETPSARTTTPNDTTSSPAQRSTDSSEQNQKNRRHSIDRSSPTARRYSANEHKSRRSRSPTELNTSLARNYSLATYELKSRRPSASADTQKSRNHSRKNERTGSPVTQHLLGAYDQPTSRRHSTSANEHKSRHSSATTDPYSSRRYYNDHKSHHSSAETEPHASPRFSSQSEDQKRRGLPAFGDEFNVATNRNNKSSARNHQDADNQHARNAGHNNTSRSPGATTSSSQSNADLTASSQPDDSVLINEASYESIRPVADKTHSTEKDSETANEREIKTTHMRKI